MEDLFKWLEQTRADGCGEMIDARRRLVLSSPVGNEFIRLLHKVENVLLILPFTYSVCAISRDLGSVFLLYLPSYELIAYGNSESRALAEAVPQEAGKGNRVQWQQSEKFYFGAMHSGSRIEYHWSSTAY